MIRLFTAVGLAVTAWVVYSWARLTHERRLAAESEWPR